MHHNNVALMLDVCCGTDWKESGVKIKVVVREAEEGGYWAEVPAIPGCATQGETIEDLIANVHEAIEACLDVEVDPPEHTPKDQILEIAL